MKIKRKIVWKVTMKNNYEDESSVNIEEQYDQANPQPIKSEVKEKIENFNKSHDKPKRQSKREMLSERLNRDALSLKRHQIKADADKKIQKEEKEKLRQRSKSRESRQREDSHTHTVDNRKSFKASHEIYGEEYSSTKYHLPPRSPTFSFRSTIDLLPSSHSKQGLRQQVSSY